MDDWVILAILAGIGWVIAGLSIFKNQLLQIQIRNFDTTEIVKRLGLKEEYIKDLEREIDGYREEIEELRNESKSWEGKYHQKGQIRKLPSDKYDLTQTSDIGLVAEDLLDQIAPSLPSDLQQIIKDPQIKQGIIKYAHEHPEQAVEYIKRFIGGPAQKSKSSQSSIIPDFDQQRAI